MTEHKNITDITVLKETTLDNTQYQEIKSVWFQWCKIIYDDKSVDYTYRFISKHHFKAGGHISSSTGFVNLPTISMIQQLLDKAKSEDWGYGVDVSIDPITD